MIERQLAHIEGNQVRRAYARGEYWDERRRMMQWWADYLDEIRMGGRGFWLPFQQRPLCAKSSTRCHRGAH